MFRIAGYLGSYTFRALKSWTLDSISDTRKMSYLAPPHPRVFSVDLHDHIASSASDVYNSSNIDAAQRFFSLQMHRSAGSMYNVQCSAVVSQGRGGRQKPQSPCSCRVVSMLVLIGWSLRCISRQCCGSAACFPHWFYMLRYRVFLEKIRALISRKVVLPEKIFYSFSSRLIWAQWRRYHFRLLSNSRLKYC